MSITIDNKAEFQGLIIDSLKYYADMNRRAVNGKESSITLYRATGMWINSQHIDLSSIKKFDPKLHDLIAKVDGDIEELNKYVLRPL